ncbi:MAG TPA: hypothetical protein VM791_13945 [Vicinamibacterales bacterium]|jgi:hypothetical protein|nr:hypothetical protein [Vicinamibacterales bacterium]
MASKPGFLDYVTAAFNARPLGMFVAPNWVGLAAFGLLGVSNPGFWVLGAGLELGYLLTLATSSRFQRAISSRPLAAARTEWNERIQRLSSRLDRNDRERFQALSQRCASIIDLQTHGGSETPQGIETQTDSLGRLSWMFLRLLVARSTILSVVREGEDEQLLAQRRAALERQARDESAPADLRRSLSGQIEILQQRIDQRVEAEHKLAYIDAELARIEEQVELIRDQAALSTDPEILSRRIDEIAATLGGTGQWIRDQQQVYGAMEDLLTEPPPLTIDARAKETQ